MTLNVVINELLEGAQKAQGTAIIVDIFRATSVLTALFGIGIQEVYPASDIESARELKNGLEKEKNQKIYIGGEKGGKTPKDFDFTNSAISIYDHSDSLRGRSAVFVSTNGANGILAAQKADEIIAASFLNYQAIGEYLDRTQPEQVTIVGMGEFGRSSPEDRGFANFLRDFLLKKSYDIDNVKDNIRKGWTVELMIDYFGKQINKEIDFCLNTDLAFNVVPKLYGNRLIDELKQK